MNNDDHFNQKPQSLTPELEARVVAWVLGEASAFEAAQLEVLCAEQPELAVFKRRIEAVHGLMGEAVKSVDASLRLSPERRAKVLAVIGGEESVAGVPAGQERHQPANPPVRARKPSKHFAWRSWAMPMAACLTTMVLLAAVIIPTVGKVQKRASRTAEFSERRQQEQMRMIEQTVTPEDAPVRIGGELGGRGVSGYDQMNVSGAASVSSESAPLVFFDKDKASNATFAADAPAPASPVPSAAPVFAARDTGEIVNTTVGGAVGRGYNSAQGQASGGFSVGLDAAEKELAVAAKPAGKRQAVTITAGTLQEFAEVASVESQQLGDQRKAWAMNDDLAGAKQEEFGGGDQSNVRLPSVAAEVRRRREIRNPAADPFAPATANVVLSSGEGLKADEKTKSSASESTQSNARSNKAVDGFAMSASMPDPVRQKLREIIIPQVNFKDVPLSKVIASLSATSEEYDRSQENRAGANIVLLDPSAKDPSVSMSFRNLSLGRMLDLITESTGYRYEITEDSVVVRPKLATDFNIAFFPVTRAVMARMMKDAEAERVSGGESEALRALFQKEGVDFTQSDAHVVYDGAAVIVNQTAANAERIRAILKRYQDAQEAADKPDLDAFRAEIPTATESVSTFSLHVSDASFRLAKAALERGQAPEAATIRPEEFYNAFDYGDPSPAAGEAVNCRIEQAAHPFLQQRNLVRIAMKVPAAGRGAGTPLRLTVLLDTSGSMEREDRAATVRAALTALTSLLGPNDRVTLIGFARTPRLLAESVTGDQAGKLVELAARTPSEGGTNLEEALALAGKLAMRQKLAGAQNRIVVLTDGAANLGDADPQALAKRVEALRQNGIAFDACGVVADGLDDSVLEALTRKGDGRYAVLNSPEEADASFARQLAGAFRPAAKDVKVQVRFNPARVARYRLIGFEQHRLKTEDFRNDAVDAAELAAEEAAVALYQVEVRPEGEGELGEVSVRFLDTGSGQRVERAWTLGYAAQAPAFARATPSLQLAGASAFLAEKLRGGALAGQVRLEEFAPVVEGLGAAYPQAARVREFITMFRQTRQLTGE